MLPFDVNKTAVKNNNNQEITVSAREQQMLTNMLKNITRCKSAVMNHIAGTEGKMKENLFAIQYGIELMMQKFDGHTIEVFKTKEFKDLAKQVYGFISKQTTGRKVFVTTVSSPIMGPSTVYFAYYLTTRIVKQEDIRLMAPFLASLENESEPAVNLDDVIIDESLKVEPKPVEVKMTIPKSLPRTGPPPPMVSPIGEPCEQNEFFSKNSLVRQSTTAKEPADRPIDSAGFWLDNESNFSEEAENFNRSIREKNQSKSEPVVKESTLDILNDIFKAEMAAKAPLGVIQTPPRGGISAVEVPLPDEIQEIEPIQTNPPAAKKEHRNAKSRLSGTRGSRAPNNTRRQNRRNSFETLPEPNRPRMDVRLNYTMPAERNIELALAEIMSRLDSLETSITKKVGIRQCRHNQINREVVYHRRNNRRNNRNQTLPRYTPPQFF